MNNDIFSVLQKIAKCNGDAISMSQEHDLNGNLQNVVEIYRDWSVGDRGFWIYYNIDGSDGSVAFYDSSGRKMTPQLSISRLHSILGCDNNSSDMFVVKLYDMISSESLVLVNSRSFGIRSWDLLRDGFSIRLAYNVSKSYRHK